MSKNLLRQPRCHEDTLHFFSYKMKRKIRLNNSAVCENNLITPTELLRGRWPTNAHQLYTFFAFCTRKKVCIKERVLSMFLLLLFNTFSLLCSTLFQKKSFLFQNVTAKASNQYFHISTSESCINIHDVQVHTFSTVCKEEKIQKCTP